VIAGDGIDITVDSVRRLLLDWLRRTVRASRSDWGETWTTTPAPTSSAPTRAGVG
jgi:hypothetical protein